MNLVILIVFITLGCIAILMWIYMKVILRSNGFKVTFLLSGPDLKLFRELIKKEKNPKRLRKFKTILYLNYLILFILLVFIIYFIIY
jgi:hypothetical protein